MQSGKMALALLLACIGSYGCYGPGMQERHVLRANGATVIGPEQLSNGGIDLLNILQNYMAAMQVRRSSDCPQILVRGRRSMLGPNSPAVYVDGTRAANTCVLESLPVVNVERVEIYPMGVTRRPGYRANPTGLILVFMKSGA